MRKKILRKVAKLRKNQYNNKRNHRLRYKLKNKEQIRTLSKHE